MTRLDQKLARIQSGDYRRGDFIIADAKDGDMGSGITTAGPRYDAKGQVIGWKTRRDYLDQIAAVVKQDIVDIMLTSVSNMELLHEQGVYRNSAVKPAIRANDATDCWGGIRGATYADYPSRPYRTAVLSRVMYGSLEAQPGKPVTGTDLGLYSITFNNNLDDDIRSLEAFEAFRAEAAKVGFSYFLEVFNPNAPQDLTPETMPGFMNDCLLRCLSGLTKADRPKFLKIPFNGAKALEELAAYDSSVVIGVLGGGAGTTRDTFELLFQAERSGARLALFGRKINLAEAPLALIAMMRRVADGEIGPAEAVRAYHGELQTAGLSSRRSLEADLEITEAVLR
ncbi:hypothetical protein [Acidisoma sp.]|uniref:hypothetical protein n=1 Tax=Acidisoma sp. TaxID=1872115 RepID=UPI003B002E1B